MVIRVIGVAIVGLALVLVGCGADTASAPPPAPISTLSDEDQIREVLTEAIDATSNWDDAKMAELSCAELRDAVTFDYMVPPMSTFPRDRVASIGPEQFANNLAEQFTGASDESVLAVAEAVMNNNDAAYLMAMKDVMKNSMTLRLDKVDNIVVTGDAATADITMTTTVGAKPPQTQVDQATLARENGQWKDCTVTQRDGAT
jgi:hypothetical protein